MPSRSYLRIKALIDCLMAVILLLIVMIPFSILTLFLACYYRGNPFYVCERAGLLGKPFKQYKFKSMFDSTAGELDSDKNRVSPVGKFLREWSIDEIPQLINIIKGDISFIGPRPLTCDYIAFYNKNEKRRLEVKPGLTGLAQVNGRNTISWAEKFKFDVAYVDQFSLQLDMKILIRTIRVVLSREGVDQNESTTAERFKG
ncbi:sugar transferase [Listeria fleischmannii]|uniref:Sugar transferase n=1 Tax=Listeria fleischmannii TaxID=1069827 RepID=A0A841YFW0_9LIST|nr:sugar transferase [Listeria fleischmannii]EIA19816.1 sugar transferase [Listeria fleischmannii subsp. coloradonensis]MBC1399171.1 sugar transferase [Listeria fleischmannii]MBC1419206.1 sugar transferase [Listeria fleischmannii]MBC1427465.1 sugar transferase [Listeria fleischmannii]STY36203.1 Putative colanic biosynthesis UDP-glucose lipid carrier transferase [Listeria fleischmannii subsp. coloradonensis]